MGKILHHVHRHKENVYAHARKHHKKYLFGLGTAIGMGIFKVMIIVAAFLGITVIVGRSDANNAEIDMYRAMNVFYQIDEIADQEIQESIEEGNPFTEESMKEFEIIDETFHNSKNLNERYRAAKKMVNFLLEQEKLRPDMENDPDEERDKEFRELLEIFNQMR